MSYEWNEGSGYTSNSGVEAYGSLEKSYPKPFEGSNVNSYRQRDNWGVPAAYEQNSRPLNMDSDFRNSANFKVIDDSQFNRSEIPTYHTLPGRETHIMPFSHAMKKSANSDLSFDKYNNIFGETRLYNSEEFKRGLNQPDANYSVHNTSLSSGGRIVHPSSMSKPQGLQNYQPQGGPRMKFFGDDLTVSSQSSQSFGDGERGKVYNAVLKYFPGFQLVKSGNHNGYGIYKALVKCLLCTGVRYIVAIVKNDPYSLGTILPLSQIKWESFQTRFAEDDRDFRQFTYESFNYEKPQETILDDRIKVVSRHKMSQIYQCDNLPLQVEILKNKEHEDLSDYGTVSGALELFQTVLSFTR